MSEKRLKLMLDYGMLTEEEQSRIVAEFKRLGKISKENKELIEILEKNINTLSAEEERLEKEEAKLLNKQEELNDKIHELRKERARKLAEAEIREFDKEKKAHLQNIREMSLEFVRINRKIKEIGDNLKKKIESKSLEKLRQKLS